MNNSAKKPRRGMHVIASFGAALTLILSGDIAVSQEKSVVELANKPDINIPSSSIERAEQARTAYHVSLRDLTKLALQNNLDIAISDTNEELYQNKILQAHCPYDPAISFTLGARSTTQPNTNLTNQSAQGASNKTRLDPIEALGYE